MSITKTCAPLSLVNHSILPPPTDLSRLGISRQPRIRCTVTEPHVTSECLRCFKYDLLRRRRTMISVSQTPEINKTFNGYVESEIILPIVALLNGLRRTPEYPVLKYDVKLNPNGSDLTTEVHFFGDFGTDTVKFPIIFFFPPLSFQQDVEDEPLSLPLPVALYSLHHSGSEENQIIVTDFSTTMLINHVDEKLTTADCEVAPSPSTVPLRYLLASYVQQPLPPGYLDLDTEDLFVAEGAPNNPDFPLPTDEDIITTRHAHADFDRYTLANSLPAVEQFFRWKTSMQARPKPALAGTVVQAKSHGFQLRGKFQPRYPIEPLPEDTLAHLRAVARPTFPQFLQLLNRSQVFSLLLNEELTPSEGTGYASTFSCHIVTVDGQMVSDDVPKKLCLKLFDDSAASVPHHTECPSLTTWSHNFYSAEDMIHNEINAYYRLEFAWGSVVPQFYGAHSFTLEDGRMLFGILMEYVAPSETKLEHQSESAQISFIQSARHALRVLQYADISQLDWSDEQWICTPSPPDTASNPTLTCVLIDFSLTAQGDRYNDGHKVDDYGDMADMLQEAGIPVELMREWFSPREEWDFFYSHM